MTLRLGVEEVWTFRPSQTPDQKRSQPTYKVENIWTISAGQPQGWNGQENY